jgi:tetratricopeptide (TPR) repeat protein
MEYVDALPLDRYIEAHAPSAARRVDLFLQIARAVAYAHGRLIVHRDLKPTNVLVKGDGEVRLLDFGIARLLEPGATHDGMRAFTPRYAAPEQFEGLTATVATDVYALGVMLYEMLAGRSPYRLMMNGVICFDIAPLKVGDEDLDAIVRKALQLDPEDRYASVVELAEDIERHRQHFPVHARAQVPAYRLRKYVRRNALAVAAAATVTLALAVGFAVALTQWRHAVRQQQFAQEHLLEVETTLDFVATVLSEGMDSDETITLNDLIERSEAIAMQTGANDPRTLAVATMFVANWYQSFGQYDKGARLLTKSLATLPPGQDYLAVQSLECLRASLSVSLGRAEEGIAALEAQIARWQDEPAKGVDCLMKRAGVARELTDPDGALRYASLALQRFEAAGRQSANDKATILSEIAFAYALGGQQDRAQEYYARAYELIESIGRTSSSTAGMLLNNWGIAVGYTGNPLFALQLYERAAVIDAQRSPSGIAQDATLANLAQAQKALARFDAAMQSYDTILRRAEAAGSPDLVAYALNGKADVVRQQGNLDLAQQLLDAAARKLRDNDISPDHPAGLRQTLVQAKIWAARDRAGDALDAYSGLIDRYEARNCCRGPQASTLLARADLHLRRQSFDIAMIDARRALGLAQREQGSTPYSSTTGNAWLMIGRIEQALGQAGAAREDFSRALLHLRQTLGEDHPDTQRARAGGMSSAE